MVKTKQKNNNACCLLCGKQLLEEVPFNFDFAAKLLNLTASERKMIDVLWTYEAKTATKAWQVIATVLATSRKVKG